MLQLTTLRLLGLFVVVLGAGLPVSAVAAPARPMEFLEETPGTSDIPTVMFVIPRDLKAPKRQNEATIALLDKLRETLNGSGKFRVLLYSPDKSPVIRRAIIDHLIDINDILEPVKPEAMQRVARAIGARYILTFTVTHEADTLIADTRFQETIGQQDWRIVFAEKITISARSQDGKKRLKTAEMADLAADNIATRMGLPSRQTEAIRAVTNRMQNEQKRPNKNDKEKVAKNDNTTFVPIESGNTTSKQTEKPDPKANGKTEPKTGARSVEPKPPTGRNTDTEAGNKKPMLPATPDAPRKTNERQTPDRGQKGDKNRKEPPRDLASAFSTDNTPGRTLQPAPPTVSPIQTPNKSDNETLALRFRQAGDLANVITALRRAINERPRDIGLRRQLVQAYQDRQMMDAALGEVSRAMQMAPDNAGLQRLFGDTLLARGDAASAMKAYREAIRLDPSDITAQVALGDALLAENQFMEALAAYEAAIKNDPKSPLPHRRLARALAGRAGTDPTQYEASLSAIQKARALTPPMDTETYLEDYVGLMRLMEQRMRDLLDELQGVYQAHLQGKRTLPDSKRLAAEMKNRADALADYLDKVPAAIGQDTTHANYQQGAALLAQAISLFREFLDKGSTSLEEAMRGAQADTLRSLSAANKRLSAARSGNGAS